jgi:putative FmdB family regulatory protein
MPTYEYECDDCHHRFEKKQSFDAKPIAKCPQCGGRLRRVFHPAPVIFKGSGFYITDNRQKPPDMGKGGSDSDDGGKEKGKKDKDK